MSYLLNFSLLKRNRNFRWLYVGQFISFMGSMVTSVAIPYQVYHQTHSTMLVGLVSLFQLMPLLVTALLGGVLADRHNQKNLLIISAALLASGALMLAWNAFLSNPQLIILFIVAILMSGLNGLHRPAGQSLIQRIVAKEDFAQVGTLIAFSASASMVIGPAIGGLIIAHYGLVVTYAIDFFSFLISLFTLFMIHYLPQLVEKHSQSAWSSLRQGIRYAGSRQELLGTYYVDFIAMIFGMPNALFPAIAHTLGDAKILGLLYSAPAVGALCVTFFSGWASSVKRHGRAIALAAGLWGVAIILFGLTLHHWIIALFFLAWAGAFDAINGIFRSIMWNETIPTEFRGRLAGIEMISYLSGPKLGDAEAGIVASIFGVTAAVISGGVLCVAGVAVCCYLMPKFFHYRSRIQPSLESSTQPSLES